MDTLCAWHGISHTCAGLLGAAWTHNVRDIRCSDPNAVAIKGHSHHTVRPLGFLRMAVVCFSIAVVRPRVPRLHVLDTRSILADVQSYRSRTPGALLPGTERCQWLCFLFNCLVGLTRFIPRLMSVYTGAGSGHVASIVCACAHVCVPKVMLPKGNGRGVIPMGTGRWLGEARRYRTFNTYISFGIASPQA